MKTNLISELFISLFLIALYSRNPDDGSGPIPASIGTFNLDSTSFSLSQGLFTDPLEDSPGLFYKTIILTDAGFNSVNNGALTGNGNAVVIEIYSPTSDLNLLGDYTITDGTPVAG